MPCGIYQLNMVMVSLAFPIHTIPKIHACQSSPHKPNSGSLTNLNITSRRTQIKLHIAMAEGSSTHSRSPMIVQERITIANSYGETLVGLLDDTGSEQLAVICHGFRSSKEDKTSVNLTTILASEGISAFRFDFSGNGESEGQFEYGNYWKEAEDLRAVILHFTGKGRKINTIIGHSKGGNVVLLYASKYGDVGTVINISGRYALDKGIEGRLGKDFEHRINEYGFIDVKDRTGKVEYRVTKESLMQRLNTDMKSAALSIAESCRVLTVHGSKDEIIPVEDAYEFDKLIRNHFLRIIDGADHNYSLHQKELASVILNFIKDSGEISKNKIDQVVAAPFQTARGYIFSKL